MYTVYYLFLVTFLVYPLIGLLLAKSITFDHFFKLIKPIFLLFLTHNILFAFGYSLKGDYFDYFMFSFEYLPFCLTIFLLFRSANIYAKIIRLLGTIAISLSYIYGIIGILMFIVISQDFEAKKIFHFESDNKTYETRRYSFGFATLASTRYTFETYRTYKYFPLEKRVDTTNFFDDKTDLQLNDELKISIVTIGNKEKILFKSTNGHSVLKSLE
jgi:hypothetical protein